MLAVDDPGSQRFITVAGGTTLPGEQKFGGGLKVNIAQEQAWGWDYLIPVCAALGFDPVSCGIFPGGGGGGVSVLNRAAVLPERHRGHEELGEGAVAP